MSKSKTSKFSTLKLLPSAAAAGALAFAASASNAQVTVYGVMDVGVTHVTNEGGSKITKLASGEVQQSRLGFRGTEDLGGGMSVFFNLEHGLNGDTGAAAGGTQFWSREARIGLVSPAGTVSMGRQAASFVDYLFKYSASMLVYGPGYYSTHPGDYDRVLNLPVDNSIKYTTPVMGGFSAGAHYGFGEQASSATLRTYSAGAGYENGPFSVGVGYFKANGPIISGVLLAPAANPFTGTNANDTFSSLGIGGGYTFGRSLIHALATEAKFGVSGRKARTFELGTRWAATDVWTIGADVSRTSVVDRDARMNILSVSAAYSFSKRTDVYAVAATEKASGRNLAGTPLVAQMFSQGASSNDKQNVFRLALRHRF